MPRFYIRGHETLPFKSEKLLQLALNERPVSVAIDASTLQFYHSGVIDAKRCGKNLNHGVLVIGLNLTASLPYYIVKNSWSADWGESGFFRLSANEDTCGVSRQASYPLI